MATADDLLSIDVRVGTVVSARPLRGARRPSLALTLDLGELGHKNAAARVSAIYEADDLVGLQVIAVVNLPPRQVAGLRSDVLVLSVDDGKGERVLLMPERPVPDGGRIG